MVSEVDNLKKRVLCSVDLAAVIGKDANVFKSNALKKGFLKNDIDNAIPYEMLCSILFFINHWF
jgi:hypothetical protein